MNNLEYFKKAKNILNKLINSNKKAVSNKLDSLLMEKLNAEGVSIKLNKEKSSGLIVNFIKFITLAGSLAITSFVLFLFVNKPQRDNLLYSLRKKEMMLLTLDNTNLQEKGYAKESKELVIFAEKPIIDSDLASKIKVEPKLDYDVKLSQDKKSIVIKPKEELKAGATYNVVLDKSTVFEGNVSMLNDLEWAIPIVPEFEVISITPKDRSIAPFNVAIEVNFNYDDFELADAEKSITISPKVAGKFKKIGAKVIFKPDEYLNPRVTYKVNVKSGIKRSNGEATREEMNSVFKVSMYDNKENNITYYNKPYLKFLFKSFNTSSGTDNVLYAGGTKQVKFGIYKIELADLKRFISDIEDFGDFAKSVELSKYKKVHEFVKEPIKGDDPNEGMIFFQLKNLQNGAYIVKAEDSAKSNYYDYQLLLINDFLTYTVKDATEDKIGTWSFNAKDTTKLKGVKITSLDCTDGRCIDISTQFSDENGFATFNGKKTLFLAEHNGGYAYISENSNYSADAIFSDGAEYNFEHDPNWLIHSETNKPIYFPKESAKYTYILMRSNRAGFVPVGEREEFTVKLCPYSFFYGNYFDSAQECLASQSVRTTNSKGILSGEVNLPAKEGEYQLRLYKEGKIIYTTNIFVKNYELQKGMLTISTDKTLYKDGDTIRVKGRLTNLVGDPIPDKKIQITGEWYGLEFINQEKVKQIEDFNKDNNHVIGGSGETIVEKVVKTDKEGYFSLTYKPDFNKLSGYTGAVSFSASYDYEGADLYRVTDYAYYTSGEDIRITVPEDNELIFGKDISVEFEKIKMFSLESSTKDEFINVLIKRKWTEQVKIENAYYNQETMTYEDDFYYDYKEEVIFDDKLVLKKGKGSIRLNNVKEGSYTIEIRNGKIRYEAELFYSYKAERSEEKEEMYKVGIKLNRDSANVGDTIKSSFKYGKGKPKEFLFLVYSNRILHWQIVKGNEKSIDYKLEDGSLGGVSFCTVNVAKADNQANFGSSLSEQCEYVNVGDPSKILKGTVKLDKASYNPGEKVVAEIDVGKEIDTVLGATVVDKTLMNEHDAMYFWSTDLYKSFYSESYRNYFIPSVSSKDFSHLFHLFSGGYGQGSGPDDDLIRKDFDDNPFWDPYIETGTSGKKSIEFKLPDTITTWTLKLWGIGRNGEVLTSYTDIKSTKEIYIDFENPKSLLAGDIWEAPFRVVNNSGRDINVDLKVLCSECGADYAEKLSINNGYSGTVKKKFKIPDKSAKVKVYATVDGKVVDGVEYKLNIKPNLVERNSFLIRELKGKESKFTFDVPDKTNIELSTVRLVLSRTLFLKPAESIEPEVASSPQLSASIMYNSLFGKGDSAKRDVTEALEVLKQRQNRNGGFSWFSYGSVDARASAQVGVNLARSGLLREIKESELLEYYTNVLEDKITPIEDKIYIAYALSIIDRGLASRYVLFMDKSIPVADISASANLHLMLSLQNLNSSANAMRRFKELPLQREDSVLWLKESTYANSLLLKYLTKAGLQSERTLLLNWLYSTQLDIYDAKHDSVASITYILDSLSTNSNLSRNDSVKLIVNGVTIKEIQLGGDIVAVSLPSESLKLGKNEIKLEGSSLEGIYVVTELSLYGGYKKGSGDGFKVKTTVVNLNGSSKSFKIGDVGYYIFEVQAKEKGRAFVVKDYLPSGIRPVDIYDPVVGYKNSEKMVKNYKNIMWVNSNHVPYLEAYFTAEENSGKSISIIYPFVVVRSGTWLGRRTEVVYVDNFNSLTTSDKPNLNVK